MEEWLERREPRRPGEGSRGNSSLVRGDERVVDPPEDHEGGREPRESVEAMEEYDS